MIQRCGSLRALVLASAALLVTGCPEVGQLGEVATPLPEQNDVLGVLGQTVTAAELADAQFSAASQLASDEPVNFGEQETPFAEVSFETIDWTEDTIFSEVTTGDGDGVVRAHGGLTGRFVNDVPDSDSDHSPGMFRGRWFAADGDVLGVVRGEYRPLRPGNLPPGIVGGGVFHGKYIDTNGRFRGFVRGRYGHREGQPGFFFGRWLDRHHRLVGVLEGHWQDDPERNGGTFRGRWAAFNICDEADSLVGPNADDYEPLPEEVLDELLADDEELDRLAAVMIGQQPVWGDLDATEEIDITEEPDVALAGDPPCIEPGAPHGFLRGGHRPTPPEDPNQPGPPHGVFHGRWHAADDRPHGQLAGRWAAIDGPPPDDPPPPGVHGHFRGRYYDRAGNIRGFLDGVYGVSPHGVGVFRGRYFNLDSEPLGILRGHWDHAPNRPGGPFSGFWVGVDFDEPDAP